MEIIAVTRIVVGARVLIEQLLYVGLGSVLGTADRTLNVGELVLMFLNLFDLHLLDVLPDLLSKQVSELVTDLMSLRKLHR